MYRVSVLLKIQFSTLSLEDKVNAKELGPNRSKTIVDTNLAPMSEIHYDVI